MLLQCYYHLKSLFAISMMLNWITVSLPNHYISQCQMNDPSEMIQILLLKKHLFLSKLKNNSAA